MRYLIFLLPFLAFGQTITLSDSDVAAFYGAVGHGKNTTGGRGQSVVFVTNTNDSGVGSLRAAVSGSNRYIVFTVSGTITLNSLLNISGSNITIAGETAPGDGIAVYGATTAVTGQNIIVRNVRFRNGVSSGDTFRIQNGGNTGVWSNYMIDHCSFSWGGDETVSVETGDTGNVTVTDVTWSNNIISQPFAVRNAMPYGGNQTDQSWIRNFLAHGQFRNLRSNQGSGFTTAAQNGNLPKQLEWIDNYIYHFREAFRMEYGGEFDAIGNVYETGPDTNGGFETFRLEGGDCNECLLSETRAYISDNIEDGGASTNSSTLTPYLQGARMFSSGYVSVGSANTKATVLADAGARVKVSGLDDLDSQMILNATDGIGSYVSSVAEAGGLPSLASGTPYVDSDGDGLSDEYEVANGAGPGNWFVSPSTRPVTAQLVSGATIDQTAVTAGIRYTHMDIFLGELAGDWTGGSSGGGTNDPATDKGRSGTSAMLIAH